MPLSLESFDAVPPGKKVPSAKEIRALAARVVMEPRTHRVALMNSIGEALRIPPGGWTQGISRLFDRGEVRLYWLLRTLAAKDASLAASKNLERVIQFVDAEVMLTLITASREHAPAVTARPGSMVDTYGEGGLDFLGAEMDSLGLPKSITSRWTSRAPARNLESGSIIQPAEIPSEDQMLAYAAQMNSSFSQRFKKYLRDLLGSQAGIALSEAHRGSVLVWKAYSFLAPGGVEYDPQKSLDKQIGQRFGIRTCLEYIQQATDKTLSLDAVLEDVRLNRSEWVRIAKVRVAEALFLERILRSTRDLLVPSL